MIGVRYGGELIDLIEFGAYLRVRLNNINTLSLSTLSTLSTLSRDPFVSGLSLQRPMLHTRNALNGPLSGRDQDYGYLCQESLPSRQPRQEGA
jgi:hypothetical protein